MAVEKVPKSFNGELLEFLKDAGPYVTVAGPVVIKMITEIIKKIRAKKKKPQETEEFEYEQFSDGDKTYIRITKKEK